MKNSFWNRHASRNLKSALLGGLLVWVGTAALAPAQSSSGVIDRLLRQVNPAVLAAWSAGGHQQNPIQSFSANPSTITAGQTTTLSWVVAGAKTVTLSGVSATPASSVVVAPTHTTTYTLTATTAGGQRVSQDVTVNVAADTSIATATINPTQPGSAIPPSYLGFSHEWGQAQLLMGDPALGTNPIYRQLLENLMAYGGGPISIRVGGNNTDTTALPDASTVRPFAQLFEDLKPSRPDQADRRRDDFRHGRGVFFYLGVNLGSDVPALAADQAKVYVQNMPTGSIQAIEVGNEPDFYPTVSHHRPSTYD